MSSTLAALSDDLAGAVERTAPFVVAVNGRGRIPSSGVIWRAGGVDSIVVQNPFRMGSESTQAIGMKLRGEAPVRLQDSGATLVLKENLDRPEIKELLFPDIQRYLQ